MSIKPVNTYAELKEYLRDSGVFKTNDYKDLARRVNEENGSVKIGVNLNLY